MLRLAKKISAPKNDDYLMLDTYSKIKHTIMKKLTCFLLLVLPFISFAQTKDYIVTIQEGEYFRHLS